MKYEAITPVQVFLSGKENTIYMLTKVTGTLTLDEIRNAEGFAVEIPEEDLEAAALAEPAEETAKKKIDHDEIIRMAQEGCTPREIAEKIGCSEQTVRNHIARG